MLALILLPMVFLVATLTLVLRDWVRDAIVTPILFILWLGGLLIKSTPQWVFWGVFLVMALLILANSFGAGKRSDQNVGKAEPGRPRRARVSFWAIQVHRQARGFSPPTSSAEPLRRLVLEVVAFQERLSLKEVEQRLESEELDVPPAILAYLQHGPTPEPLYPVGLWGMLRQGWADFRRAAHGVLGILAGRWAHDLMSGLIQTRLHTQSSPFDSELESVVQFLEDRLEIKHDD
jgi:hypothetical protein